MQLKGLPRYVGKPLDMLVASIADGAIISQLFSSSPHAAAFDQVSLGKKIHTTVTTTDRAPQNHSAPPLALVLYPAMIYATSPNSRHEPPIRGDTRAADGRPEHLDRVQREDGQQRVLQERQHAREGEHGIPRPRSRGGEHNSRRAAITRPRRGGTLGPKSRRGGRRTGAPGWRRWICRHSG